ncbi:hypothetical protein KC850_04475, partial [Candidatus Kaiserbacteria bacterium]|nr:hypothetical protein [Candidatus Kaiserbacteria bacterium]
SICKIEPAGSGGGGSSGGGSSGGGGSTRDLGDTIINIKGRGYPSRTVNFLLDTVSVGSVGANNQGDFEFSTKASPGTATLGIWSTDNKGNRSITLNNTFDVTQGAITNVNGVVLPPTISVPNQNVDPGAEVIVSGQSYPRSTIELHVDNSAIVEEVISGTNGEWSVVFDTSRVSIS